MNFFIFSRFSKYRFWKKNRAYNRATVSSITQKILLCDMESWYKNITNIPNVAYIFQN